VHRCLDAQVPSHRRRIVVGAPWHRVAHTTTTTTTSYSNFTTLHNNTTRNITRNPNHFINHINHHATTPSGNHTNATSNSKGSTQHYKPVEGKSHHTALHTPIHGSAPANPQTRAATPLIVIMISIVSCPCSRSHAARGKLLAFLRFAAAVLLLRPAAVLLLHHFGHRLRIQAPHQLDDQH
jgi:hypothetical protein